MALTCGTIAANITASCAALPTAGTTANLYLANYADVDKAGSTLSSGAISDIAMVTSKVFYKIEGDRLSLEVNVEQDNTGIVAKYRPSITFRTFDLTQAIINEIRAMGRGRVIAIVEPKGQSASRPFYVFGWDNGLRAEELAWDLNSVENSGMPALTLTSPAEESGEDYPARIFLDTDYATTATAMAALVSGGAL